LAGFLKTLQKSILKTDKDDIKGLIGTILFHALLVGGLLLMALRTPLPLPEEAGVEVNLGNSEDGMGEIQPEQLSAGGEVSPPANSAADEEIVSENTEETPAIQPVKKEKPQPAAKPETKPAVKPEVKPAPQPVTNPNAIYKGKQGGNSGGNQGISGKPGDQGRPDGTPGSDNYDGAGGNGNGVSFSLAGRSSRQLPPPNKNFTEKGTVVVTIYVNRSGSVTRVIAGTKGSTTSNLQLLQLAEQAARQAKFSPKEDAPEEQKGSITYIFELN
jgi:TonB family protein